MKLSSGMIEEFLLPSCRSGREGPGVGPRPKPTEATAQRDPVGNCRHSSGTSDNRLHYVTVGEAKRRVDAARPSGFGYFA